VHRLSTLTWSAWSLMCVYCTDRLCCRQWAQMNASTSMPYSSMPVLWTHEAHVLACMRLPCYQYMWSVMTGVCCDSGCLHSIVLYCAETTAVDTHITAASTHVDTIATHVPASRYTCNQDCALMYRVSVYVCWWLHLCVWWWYMQAQRCKVHCNTIASISLSS
jgi:hypothetical protein